MTESTNMTAWSTWLPPAGTWFEWLRGRAHQGGATVAASYTLDEAPVFVREGAVLPLRTDDTPALGEAQTVPTSLKLLVFPGASGAGWLYDDDGLSNDYLIGHSAITRFASTRQGSAVSLVVAPAEGSFTAMPAARTYDVRFVASWPADTVTVNGVAVPYDTSEAPAQNWLVLPLMGGGGGGG
jgi:hypothetical protein